MWTVLKFNKKKINLLYQDLELKLGKDIKIYRPKVIFERFKNNKLIKKEADLLGDYLFCYHEKLTSFNLSHLSFLRGLKYLLTTCSNSQLEINNFINLCKKAENKDGYISENFFELVCNQEYKFSSGPFAEKIFKIVNLQKNRINIVMGNIKTSITKGKYLFSTI
jgi:hypothetical protein